MRNSQDRTSVRQNAEYTASRKHAANLRRNPTLHFQIGLILALLVTIFFMEVRMPETAYKIPDRDYDEEEAVWDERFLVEPKVVEIPIPKFEEPAPVQPQLPDEVTPVDDDHTLIETVIKGTSDTTPDEPIVDPNTVPYVEIPVEVADVPFFRIEEVPLFPGCEGLDSNDERKACMSAKIKRFVNKKFDTDIAVDLGLTGVNRIFVRFTVDKTGAITDIQSRAPHDKLGKEAQRVIDLLPQMQPGKQRKVPVGVIYDLPITLNIQD